MASPNDEIKNLLIALAMASEPLAAKAVEVQHGHGGTSGWHDGHITLAIVAALGGAGGITGTTLDAGIAALVAALDARYAPHAP